MELPQSSCMTLKENTRWISEDRGGQDLRLLSADQKSRQMGPTTPNPKHGNGDCKYVC